MIITVLSCSKLGLKTAFKRKSVGRSTSVEASVFFVTLYLTIQIYAMHTYLLRHTPRRFQPPHRQRSVFLFGLCVAYHRHLRCPVWAGTVFFQKRKLVPSESSNERYDVAYSGQLSPLNLLIFATRFHPPTQLPFSASEIQLGMSTHDWPRSFVWSAMSIHRMFACGIVYLDTQHPIRINHLHKDGFHQEDHQIHRN
jgi:hypothetical protein